MKKLVMVFALGAMLGSCGSDPADIEVKSLDTPCACAEASVAVLKEMADFKQQFQDLGEEPSEDKMKELQADAKVYEDKLEEIQSKCKGDLDPTKAEDCPAAEEMMTLVKEIGLQQFLLCEYKAHQLMGFYNSQKSDLNEFQNN